MSHPATLPPHPRIPAWLYPSSGSIVARDMFGSTDVTELQLALYRYYHQHASQARSQEASLALWTGIVIKWSNSRDADFTIDIAVPYALWPSAGFEEVDNLVEQICMTGREVKFDNIVSETRDLIRYNRVRKLIPINAVLIQVSFRFVFVAIDPYVLVAEESKHCRNYITQCG